MSLIMPVNNSDSLEGFDGILANDFDTSRAQYRRGRQRSERHAFQGINAVGADRLRATQYHRLVDKIGGEKRRRNDRAAFKDQPGDAPLGKQANNSKEVKPARGRRRNWMPPRPPLSLPPSFR